MAWLIFHGKKIFCYMKMLWLVKVEKAKLVMNMCVCSVWKF